MMDTGCYETVLAEMKKLWAQKHIIQTLTENYLAAEAKQNSSIPASRCEEVFEDKNDPYVGACFGK